MMPTVFIICLELQHIMLKAVRRSIPVPSLPPVSDIRNYYFLNFHCSHPLSYF